MNDYVKTGIWFAIPASLITWIGCLVYAVTEYGWFIGTPSGAIVGIFFAFLAGIFAIYLWPLIALALLGLVYIFLKN